VGATADTIWEVPAYLPCLQPPLTDEAVANAEEQIRHTLPAAYLALLKKQNGGYIRFSLPNMTQAHRMIAGIGPNFWKLSRRERACATRPIRTNLTCFVKRLLPRAV